MHSINQTDIYGILKTLCVETWCFPNVQGRFLGIRSPREVVGNHLREFFIWNWADSSRNISPNECAILYKNQCNSDVPGLHFSIFILGGFSFRIR